MQGMEISGTCPMLYAVFDAAGGLRRKAVAQQIAAAIASGKLVAALRLRIAPAFRALSDIATPPGESWARRFAAELGPLPA